MNALLLRAIVVFAALAPMLVHAEGAGPGKQQGRPAEPEKKYVLFIHAGPLPPTSEVVRNVTLVLARRGYLVRAPDDDLDAVGGPGVDYFDDSARSKAEEIADIVNDILPKLGIQVADDKKLRARKQNAKNPAEYLGVWLFDKSTKAR